VVRVQDLEHEKRGKEKMVADLERRNKVFTNDAGYVRGQIREFQAQLRHERRFRERVAACGERAREDEEAVNHLEILAQSRHRASEVRLENESKERTGGGTTDAIAIAGEQELAVATRELEELEERNETNDAAHAKISKATGLGDIREIADRCVAQGQTRDTLRISMAGAKRGLAASVAVLRELEGGVRVRHAASSGEFGRVQSSSGILELERASVVVEERTLHAARRRVAALESTLAECCFGLQDLVDRLALLDSGGGGRGGGERVSGGDGDDFGDGGDGGCGGDGGRVEGRKQSQLQGASDRARGREKKEETREKGGYERHVPGPSRVTADNINRWLTVCTGRIRSLCLDNMPAGANIAHIAPLRDIDLVQGLGEDTGGVYVRVHSAAKSHTSTSRLTNPSQTNNRGNQNYSGDRVVQHAAVQYGGGGAGSVGMGGREAGGMPGVTPTGACASGKYGGVITDGVPGDLGTDVVVGMMRGGSKDSDEDGSPHPPGWRRELHKKMERRAAPPEEKSGAVRIQAAHRGRQARKDMEEKRKHQRDGNPHPPGWRRDLHTKQVEEKRARHRGAVQIQAAHRGRKARASSSSARVKEKKAGATTVAIESMHRPDEPVRVARAQQSGQGRLAREARRQSLQNKNLHAPT
jgi:hypothetical protein